MTRIIPGLASLALAAVVVASCGDDPARPDADLGLPISGRFAGTVAAAAEDTVRFVAGRTGETTVHVCAAEGTELSLALDGASASSQDGCARLTFDAVGGTTYRLTLRPTDGAGPYAGCWSGAYVTCTATRPTIGHPGIPEGYYLTAEGLAGSALLSALNEIVDGQEYFSYADARDSLYASVEDPDDDDLVTDIYVGRTATVFDRASALAADFNAEHSWPQSRGANEPPAESDLHILFPADESANGQRLNHPFGEVTGAVLWESPAVPGQTERSRLGLDAGGRTVFEPRDSKKGDIARALLYFYVRYGVDPADRTPSFALSNFNVEEATLLRWAQEDPPSAYELARNDLVYRVQGNRNPFVDRPDFLEAIGDFPNTVTP